MTIITGPRGAGRTTELIQRFLGDPDGLMCVPHQQNKRFVLRSIWDYYEAHGITPTPEMKADLDRRVLTAEAFTERGRTPFHTRVYVDDADLVLSFFLRNEVEALVLPAGDVHQCRVN
jgi:hypothetical protein